MDDSYILVLVTVPNEAEGRKVAQALLEQRLAACVNIVPGLRSLYTWKGQANDDAEVLLIIKSRAELFAEGIVPAVKAVHPYEVPEIIALPIVMGSEAYLNWITEETQQNQTG